MSDPHALGLGYAMLLHGAFSDFRFWDAVAAKLKRAVVAPALYGYYPCSLVPRDFSARRHVDEIVALIRGIDRPVDLVGHSRGGRLALAIAHEEARLVRSLVLVEPGGVMTPDFLKGGTAVLPADLAEDATQALAAGDPEEAARIYLEWGHGDDIFTRSATSVRQTAVANAHTLPGMLVDRTVPLDREMARNIRCPTLLVHGNQSPEIYRQIIEALDAEIPSSHIVSIDGADHFLPASASTQLAKCLENWLPR